MYMSAQAIWVDQCHTQHRGREAVALPPLRKLELINSALTESAYRWLCYCLLVSQARPTNPSVADHFQYLFPMCNTESDLHCVLIGSKLAGLLTAKC